MKILEQILKEIEEEFDKRVGTQLKIMASLQDEVYRYGHGKSLEAYQQSKLLVEEIIRSHMEDGGWIPIEERLPTQKEYLKNDGRFILDDGNRRYQGLFDIYDGKFKFTKHVSGINYDFFEDKCVRAWQPLPERFRPKED